MGILIWTFPEVFVRQYGLLVPVLSIGLRCFGLKIVDELTSCGWTTEEAEQIAEHEIVKMLVSGIETEIKQEIHEQDEARMRSRQIWAPGCAI